MQRSHAVVIGASIGGLVAARVLSTHFSRVTVVDRDALPAAAGAQRAAVPQGRHGHGLLASGLKALAQLFPTIERELVDAGALPGDVIGDVRWHQHGFYKAKFASGLAGLLVSRPLLEGAVRAQVRRLPNVELRSETHALELVTGADGSVAGVKIQTRGQGRTELGASLVVDAGGRGSPSPEWLVQLGYQAPAVESVAVDLSYTSRVYRRTSADLDGDRGVVVTPTPPTDRRFGVLLAMEGDRWMATLGGWLGERAPTDPAGFLAYARSLACPDIHDAICRAEPLTDAVLYRFPCNLRRRYERLGRFPGGYLVTGDALCRFNPVYGQGMSVAALEGLLLERCLAGDPSRLPDWRRFFREAARIIDTPWTIAAGSDFAFPGVTGRKPAGTDLVNWYLGKVHRAASTDPTVCRAFFDVANMLRPDTTLFRPGILARVAKECVSPARRAAAPQPPTRSDAPSRLARPA